MRKPSTLQPFVLALTLALLASLAIAQEAAQATAESAASVSDDPAATVATATATEPESPACPALQRPICHREAGKEPMTVCLRLRDIRTHLAHGDSSFPCGGQPGPQIATTAPPFCSAGQLPTCHRKHTPGGDQEWTTICLGSEVEQKKHLDGGDRPGECQTGANRIKCADGQVAMCHNGRDEIPSELLCVLEADTQAHLDHGDRFGACDSAPPAATGDSP